MSKKEQIYKEQERYVTWSNAIQAKIRYAYEIKDRPKESPKKGSDKEQSPEEKLGNEYLDLEQPENVPAVRQISRHELDLMFGTGMTPTSNMPSPQKTMDEKIPEILKESRVTTPISDESKEKPLPQREKIKKTHVSPIGGNTIPIKYSKEIGRYGGIERPTSTEARQSQKNAVQAAENFFGRQENTPEKERSMSLNGVPVEELAWDYHDGTIQVPTTKSEKTAPDVVVRTQKGLNTQERIDTSPSKKDRSYGRRKFTSLRPFKEVVKRQVKQVHGGNNITMANLS